MVERKLLSQNYQVLLGTIAAAAVKPAPPTLLAATKSQSAATIEAIYDLGVRHVGENYLAEAQEKMTALSRLDLTWHFIGRMQSNKTGLIANAFDWVHTVDRIKIARRLSAQRTKDTPLNVLIQVNIDQDPNKGGIPPTEVLELALLINALPNLRLRGLMTILNAKTNPGVGYRSVAQLAAQVGTRLHAQQDAVAHSPGWDSLSMGMSGDVAEATAAGSTIVRVGTALFGQRDPVKQNHS